MRSPRARVPFLLLLLAAPPAGAQQVVTSARPERVAVTLYRDPGHSFATPLDVEWLNGFALVTETRQVTIPAGEAEVRFEGVAGGILPQSAIVTGLPDGVIERNRDAWLLSPESLLDRSLGRRVHLRRTSQATGIVSEQDAVIRSGADGAVVLQTAAGYEALRCTGLPEMPVYEGVPEGLAARPTLSVRTQSDQARTATVTLSYLSSGFDWRANYVATLSPDGGHIDMFAWLVLASSDETSFVNAQTQTVAGRLNREPVDREEPVRRPLQLRCWPQATTSDIPLQDLAMRRGMIGGQEISISADEIADGDPSVGDNLNDLPSLRSEFSQAASQEALGDLKLFRIPEPVTVAARSVKQVAFLQRTQVPVHFVYRHRLYGRNATAPEAARRFLLARNRSEDSLGVVLPGGRMQLFTEGGGRPILAGEGTVTDYAVNEDVEIELGAAPGVTSSVTAVGAAGRRRDFLLTVANDRDAPVQYEAIFEMPPQDVRPQGAQLTRRDGKPLWAVAIPAHGTATLRFRQTLRGEN